MTPPVTSAHPAHRSVGLNPAGWWGVFLVATISLSLFFKAFKAFSLTPDLAGGLQMLGVTALMLMTLAMLVYDSYVKDKVKGKVHHPFQPFENLFARQYGSLETEGDGSCLK